MGSEWGEVVVWFSLTTRPSFGLQALSSDLSLGPRALPALFRPLALPYSHHLYPSPVPHYRSTRSLFIPIFFLIHIISSIFPYSTDTDMPAIRTTPTKAQSTSPPGSITKSPGWSRDQKSRLFNHVLKVGETDWKNAVPGKTSQQVSLWLSLADDSVVNSGSEFVRGGR